MTGLIPPLGGGNAAPLYSKSAEGVPIPGHKPDAPAPSVSIDDYLSTGLTLASVAASFFGGRSEVSAIKSRADAEESALNRQASDADMAAKQEELNGKRASNDILDALVQTLGAQQLAFASNGVDGAFGTPGKIANATTNQAERQLGITRSDTLMRAILRRRQAYSFRESAGLIQTAAGNSASSVGIGTAGKIGGTLAEKMLRERRRG